MSEPLQLAFYNLIARVGLDAALAIIRGISSAKTIDEAITALQETQRKTLADYKREAGILT